jgi:hypothetical protein
MTDARRGKKYCSKKCKRISRRIIAQRWHVAHPEHKEVKKPAKKEKPEEKKSFLSDVEDLGRKNGVRRLWPDDGRHSCALPAFRPERTK